MIPLRIRTHYSIGLGYSKADQIIRKCQKQGYTSACICDINSLGGSVEFSDTLTKGIKNKQTQESFSMKPMIGLEISTVENNGTLFLIAKNKDGWTDLIYLSSMANTDEFYKDHPRINFANLPKNGNLICITGYNNSYAAKAIFSENIDSASTVEEVQAKLDINCIEESVFITNKLQEIFGVDNVFIGVSIDNSPQSEVLTEIYRNIGKDLNISVVAIPEIFYVEPEDQEDHHITLCGNLDLKLKNIDKYHGPEYRFFDKRNITYHIRSEEELLKLGYSQVELDNTNLVNDLCEPIKLSHPPRLPKYQWTDGLSEIDYLRKLCREGWKRRYNDTWDKEKYAARIKYELDVVEKNNLAGYFLIVQDFINYAKNKKILIGPGRGSAGGCLISYLTRITEIDPVKYNLTFERFYNEGRNSPGNISLPDIDTDVPVAYREMMIEYLRMQYGYDRVAQMATYGRSQGRGAIQEVLRVHDYEGDPDEVTRNIPEEHKIADEMEADGEVSTILWTLKYKPELLEQYCKYENGVFTGLLSKYFEQAIRIEGTIKSRGKHAAGIIVSPVDLKTVCPMVHNPSGTQLITELDMEGAKNTGLPKIDILGLAALDKLMAVNSLLRHGKINV